METKGKHLLVAATALVLAGCATRGVYTPEESAAIVERFRASEATRLVYLHGNNNSFLKAMDKVGGKPFYCYLDGQPLGGVTYGEYVVAPVKAGEHHIYCTKEYAQPQMPALGALAAAAAGALMSKGGVMFRVGTGDAHIVVRDPVMTLLEPRIQILAKQPRGFAKARLSKDCVRCAAPLAGAAAEPQPPLAALAGEQPVPPEATLQVQEAADHEAEPEAQPENSARPQ